MCLNLIGKVNIMHFRNCNFVCFEKKKNILFIYLFFMFHVFGSIRKKICQIKTIIAQWKILLNI